MSKLKYLKKGFAEYKSLSKEIHKETGIGLCDLRFDMLKCALLYGARPSDYKLFSFHKLSRWEREKYMTNYRWLKLLKMKQLLGGGADCQMPKTLNMRYFEIILNEIG